MGGYLYVIEGSVEEKEDDEEDVSSYGVTLRQREGTGSWKRKYYIALYGELDLQEAVDLSLDR